VEIAPGVHAVRLRGANAHVIVEDELTLIDAGLAGSGRMLRRYLEHIGRSQADIARIVCTHSHPDHIGGVREIAFGHETEVLMHPADAARLRIGWRDLIARPTPSTFVALITRGPEDARPLVDGDVLPVLGGLRVVHTPGHTPGSICLYAPALRLLFVGDVLQVLHGRLSFASQFFSDDMALAKQSVAKLAALDVETIAFAHYTPWRDRARDALRELATAS
jgi:glyoxylase-like metal-dependent hydrolase (beta-lactamase superfamily II)